jgi:hypothetical protein
MALPPLLAGAVQETAAEPFPATAETPVGAPGTVAGVTWADGDEADPVPVELVAVTVNVYGVPLVRPLTVQGLDGPEQVRPPGDEVAV